MVWLRTAEDTIVNSRFIMHIGVETRGTSTAVVLKWHDGEETVLRFSTEDHAMQEFEEYAAVLTNVLVHEMLGG